MARVQSCDEIIFEIFGVEFRATDELRGFKNYNFTIFVHILFNFHSIHPQKFVFSTHPRLHHHRLSRGVGQVFSPLARQMKNGFLFSYVVFEALYIISLRQSTHTLLAAPA